MEHNVLYQYQFANTRNIFAGFVQTETPYYQPTPSAPTPFSVVQSLNDPDFATSCAGKFGNCANAWGLRILNSNDVLIYGAGLYSFFNDYSTSASLSFTLISLLLLAFADPTPACSNINGPENCQTNIFSLEGPGITNINVYNLNTVGTTNMITQDGTSLASYADNVNVFPDTIALFRTSTSIIPPPPPPPRIPSLLGWNFRGCYTDVVAARTLGVTMAVPAVTVEACVLACDTAGYSIAGVEWSVECCECLLSLNFICRFADIHGQTAITRSATVVASLRMEMRSATCLAVAMLRRLVVAGIG